MRSRSSAFSTRSDAQDSLGLALHAGEVAGEAVALVAGAVELGLQLRFFRLERFVRGTGAVVELGDRGAQIAFGLARGFDLAAQLLQFEFALGEQLRLLAEPALQIVRAAAEDFRFGRLRRQMLFELADAAAEVLDLAALLFQFLRRGLERGALDVAAVFGHLDVVAGIGEPLLERLDLGLERDDLDLLGCR